jgi:hypothetical protein
MRGKTASPAKVPLLGAPNLTVKSTGSEGRPGDSFGLLQLCYKSVDSQQRPPAIDSQTASID